jgi:hydroxymethylpyrimidine/phosphomethylpyrimidine kinase
MSNRPTPTVLTIAGFDPYGGAGVGLDSKVIHALGGYALSTITALTVQNSLGVLEVSPTAIPLFKRTLFSLLDDMKVDAVKIGMLANREMIEVVVEAIEKYHLEKIVLDTVLVSSSGKRLLEESAIETMVEKLFPLVELITPNIPEAQTLTHSLDVSDVTSLASSCMTLGTKGVLVKGGHSQDSCLAEDYFYSKEGEAFFVTSPRVQTTHTHGTGCFLSSAIATELAKSTPLPLAIERAKAFLYAQMKEATERLNLHYTNPSPQRREPLL